MLTTIKVYYDRGKIILTEQPPITGPAEVIITFLTDEKSHMPARKLGGFEAKIKLPADLMSPSTV